MNLGDKPEKNKTVCFSGHRPEKLPDSGNPNSSVIKVLRSLLYKAILDCIECGYNCFIVGLARGVDLWAGEILMELKAHGKNIRIIAVLPFREHGANFHGEEKFILGNILNSADKTVCISEEYSKDCFRRRNEYMVDNSGKLIAVVSDYKSGTGSTIRYAKKCGISTRIIDAKRLEEQINGFDDSDILFDYEQLIL